MRVVVVAEPPLTSSSTQFRALEHLPRLRARLGEVDAFTLDDVERGRGRLDQSVSCPATPSGTCVEPGSSSGACQPQ